MIQLDLKEYCDGDCAAFSPVVKGGNPIYDSDECVMCTDIYVQCEHRKLCEQITRYLRKQLKKQEDE